MGYPDTFQGFMISDQKKWTDFQKKEVFLGVDRPMRLKY